MVNKSSKLKSVKVRGKLFYEDNQGNQISADYVKDEPVKIRTPKDSLPAFQEIRTKQQEHVAILTLDGNNQVIKMHVITKGVVNQCIAHPREIFRVAIADNAVSVFLAHNHPSGNLEESEADLTMTKRMVEAGKILGITVLDHVILTSLSFKSIRESHPFYFG